MAFPSGAYDFVDLDDFLHQFMSEEGHVRGDGENKSYDVNIVFYHKNFICAEQLSNGYQVDLRGTRFGELIGFDEELITKTTYSKRVPNITDSIDSLQFDFDIVTDYIVGGTFSNTLFVIPVNNYE